MKGIYLKKKKTVKMKDLMLHLMATCLILRVLSSQGSTNVAASAARSCLSGFWSQLDQ